MTAKPLKFGDVDWIEWDALDKEQRRAALALWRDIPSPRRMSDFYGYAVERATGRVVLVGRYEGPEEEPEVALCETCDGKGSFECENCDGRGEHTAECDLRHEHDVDCDECDAEGTVDCDDCQGTGSEEA